MSSAYRALKAAFQAFARMPCLVLTTFALILLLGIFGRTVGEWIGAPYNPILPHDGVTHHAYIRDPFLTVHSIIGLVTNALRAFFIAPLAVSVHRFVLMGEARDKVAVDLSLLDFRFAVWAAATGGITETLIDVPVPLHLHATAALLYVVVLNIPMIYVLSRISLMFPLLAAGTPAPLRTSWRLTKGHAARIASVTAVILIFTFLLIGLLYIPCRLVLHKAAHLGWIQLETVTTPVVAIYVFAGSTVSIGAFAAMASNFLLEYRKPKAD